MIILSPLLLTAIWSLLPTSRHHSLVCSAGSKGYHALKEMLQNGKPGNTLLFESGDLREVVVGGDEAPVYPHPCCLIKTMVPGLAFDLVPTLPPHVSHVVLLSNLVTLPMGVITTKSTGLTSLRLGYMPQLRELPGYFPGGSSTLTSLDLTLLSHQLTSLPKFFLSGCKGLTSMHMNPLSYLTELPEFFMMDCTGLTEIDLTPMSHLTKLPSNFMCGCTGLARFDLRQLPNLVELPLNLLYGCTGLKTVKVSPMPHVTELPSNFLNGCTGLTTLDLSPLSGLTSVPFGFLPGCAIHRYRKGPI